MKKFKKKHFLLLFIPILIGISVFSVVTLHNKQERGLKQEFVVDISQKNYRKVYLLDENKYLIPLSIDVSDKLVLVDEIYSVVSNLRDLEIEGFTSVLPKDTKINKIELNNNILNIDFSKEMLEYPSELEEKIIESLTWSVLDFDEVKGLTLSVDGVKLERMPVNGLPLPNVLNKEIGINKYHDMVNDFSGSDDVIVIYQKVINDKRYYVPVTRKVIKEDNPVATVVNAMGKEISVLSGLRVVSELKSLLKNDFDYQDEVVNVNLDQDYLVEDNLIDASVYELLLVAMMYNDLEIQVNFFIDEESVEVAGYNREENVSNVVFNEIQF